MRLQKNNDIRKDFCKIFDKDELKRIDNIILYIRSSEYTTNVQEEILYDVLIMLKDAKDRGDSIDNTIGDNDEKFLKEIFQNIPYKKQGIMYYISYAVANLAILHLLYLGFKNGFKNILNLDFCLSEFMIYPFILFSVWFILKLIHKTVYTKGKNFILYTSVEIVLALIFFALIFAKNSAYNYNLTSKFLILLPIFFFFIGNYMKKKNW